MSFVPATLNLPPTLMNHYVSIMVQAGSYLEVGFVMNIVAKFYSFVPAVGSSFYIFVHYAFWCFLMLRGRLTMHLIGI